VPVSAARVSARGARRWVEAAHPWIYRSDVEAVPAEVPGVVSVEDARGEPIGMALWSPASAIALRMLTRDQRAIDGAFWRERLENARRYREALAPDASAYRLVHAESDGLPSLIVDRYGDTLVVQLLSAGLESRRGEIVAALEDVFAPAGILARNDVPVRRHERLTRSMELLAGAVPESIEVREGPIRYLAAPWTGQKTGAFLDQRENRARAGAHARGRALDCFSYHGSFALHLAAGAAEVTAVDSSAEALERAASNAALNGFAHLSTVQANVFDFLRSEDAGGAAYDVIVLDPPAFAKNRSSVPGALRGYKEINLRALKLLSPGGTLLTFSCSYHVDRERFRTMLESAAADSGRPVHWIEARGQALDHPEVLQIPESGYLKGAILRVP
jgi:23S rRNA (cytosine1962-C5)-methyltransferase